MVFHKRLIYLLIIFVIFTDVFATSPVRTVKEPFLQSYGKIRDLAQGRNVYDQHCAVCHGTKGNGDGKEAHRFKNKPTDFTRGQFKFKSTYPGSLPFSGDIYRSVTEGVRGTGMLAQLHLTNQERWSVVEYIKTFSTWFEGASILLNEGIVVPDAPAKSAELISAGRQLYLDGGCNKCHGEIGKGDGPSVGELKDSRGNPVQMPDLTMYPKKMGDQPEDIYMILLTGMDGTPMPSYQDAYNETQLWALVHYLDSIATSKHNNCMGMMGRRMDMVGEECIGMKIAMPAARAKMMRNMRR